MEICILDLDKNIFGSRHIEEFNILFGDKMNIKTKLTRFVKLNNRVAATFQKLDTNF